MQRLPSFNLIQRGNFLFTWPTMRSTYRSHSLLENRSLSVCGNIHGLPHAPHLWSQEVIGRLRSTGYRQRDFDKMMFCKYDSDGNLQSAVNCYVDDFLGINRHDYDAKELHDLFKWGEFGYFDLGVAQTLKGKELCFTKNESGRFVLKIAVNKFLEAVDPYVLPRVGRRNHRS